MERRLLSWVIASTAFLFIYISLNGMFGPPKPPQPDPLIDQAEVAADLDALPGADSDPQLEAVEVDIEEEARPTKTAWQTLGSYDAESGYRMLVYLNNRGAGIERIELTERNKKGRLRYRRVDVQGGYAGYMALEDSLDQAGPRINVIGPATPVALATSQQTGIPDGLQVGDLITSVKGKSTPDRQAFADALEKIEPGTKVTVTVLRGLETELAEETTDEEAPESSDGVGVELAFDVELTEHPLDLIRLSSRGGEDEIPGNLDRLSCLMTLSQVAGRQLADSETELASLPSQHNVIWDVEEQPASTTDEQQATYRLPVSKAALQKLKAEPVELIHRYTLGKGSYLIDMEVGIENKGEKDQNLAYRLDGPNGITLEGWWYSNKISPNFGGAGARDILYKNSGSGDVLWGTYALIKERRKKEGPPAKILFSPDDPESERELNFIGVDAQYFTVAYVPVDEPFFKEYTRAAATLVCDEALLPKHQERAANTSFYLDSKQLAIPAGETVMHKVRMFAGPKQEALLAEYGLSDAIYYGWFPMIAKPLQAILHFLNNNITFNYAFAIVLLTLMVRMLMFPLGRRAAMHAQKMQELAPQLKAIGEKYKDDMEGRLKAQRELQQRAGFNPLSGCLPMFIQLPIFIGLYRCLSVDIELRQAALSPSWQWCSNLAAPDMLYYWGDWMWEYMSGRGTGWLGPYFNILPMLVMLLFLAQQKMFMPPATDEQTAMTQKVMTFMTLFMGFLFFRVPSGLCIYFITSSLWGIAERKLVKKSLPPKTEGGGVLAYSTPSGPTGDGSDKSERPKSFVDRMKERIANEPPPALRPDKRKRPNVKKKK